MHGTCNLVDGRCTRCGRANRTGRPDASVRMMCRVKGLGDHISSALAHVGITPERYTAIKQRLGLAPKCGCKKRQVALNKFGRGVARLRGRIWLAAQGLIALFR